MSDYEKRYHVHSVWPEQAEREEYDAPNGCSSYLDTWSEVEALASRIGWERIAWVTEGYADYEDVPAGSKRRGADGDYTVGISGTLITRRTSGVVYTNPVIVRNELRAKEMQERVSRAMRDGRTVSVILRKDDEHLVGLTPLTIEEKRFTISDETLPLGTRDIYFPYVQQLVCQGEQL